MQSSATCVFSEPVGNLCWRTMQLMADPELRNDAGGARDLGPYDQPRLKLVGLRLEYCHSRLAVPIAAWLARACRERRAVGSSA
jgi:hypothetical protein